MPERGGWGEGGDGGWGMGWGSECLAQREGRPCLDRIDVEDEVGDDGRALDGPVACCMLHVGRCMRHLAHFMLHVACRADDGRAL